MVAGVAVVGVGPGADPADKAASKAIEYYQNNEKRLQYKEGRKRN